MPPSYYRVARLIARDGLAESFEAFGGGGSLERRVSLRRVLAEHRGEASLVGSFLDVARPLARVQHAGLSELLDFGLGDGLPFFVEDAVDGADLDELLDRAKAISAPAPPEAALQVAVEIGLALFHLHTARDERGRPMDLVHAEVRPRNVLLAWTGAAKLAGLGVARLRQRLESAGALSDGTSPGNRAPEQLRGEALDARTDVFGLGAVLHQLLTGKSAIVDTREGRTEIDPTLEPGLGPILERALHPERRERHASAVELAEEAGAWLARYGRRDPRLSLREWAGQLRPTEIESGRARRAELFMLELATHAEGNESNGVLRRFQSSLGEDMDVFGSADLMLAPAAPPAALAGAPRAVVISTPTYSVPAGGTPLPPRIEPAAKPSAPSTSSATADPLLGTVIHGFVLAERIGTGSVARVYRGVHQVLPRECAVKVLDPQQAMYDISAQRLKREAQMLANIAHPNLVKVIDFGTTPEGAPFLMLELLRGQTLKEILEHRSGPLPVDEARDLLGQIASGLAAAHEHGLVHRDLKPANVMLVSEGGRRVVKILDFGLARVFDPTQRSTTLTSPQSFLGTPRYIAPEQILGASTTGPGADLYSLGVILHQMLSGEAPFTGTVMETVNAHLYELPPPLPPSGGLERIARRLMEKAPEDRLPSARAVLEELEKIQGPVLIANASEGPTAPASPARPDRLMISPLRLAGLILLLIAIALVLGTALARLTAPEPKSEVGSTHQTP